MNGQEAQALDEIKAAMRGNNWRLEPVMTWTHGQCIQVYARPPGRKNYVKVGPFIVPNEGEDIFHVLTMLGNLAVGKDGPG